MFSGKIDMDKFRKAVLTPNGMDVTEILVHADKDGFNILLSDSTMTMGVSCFLKKNAFVEYSLDDDMDFAFSTNFLSIIKKMKGECSLAINELMDITNSNQKAKIPFLSQTTVNFTTYEQIKKLHKPAFDMDMNVMFDVLKEFRDVSESVKIDLDGNLTISNSDSFYETSMYSQSIETKATNKASLSMNYKALVGIIEYVKWGMANINIENERPITIKITSDDMDISAAIVGYA